LHHFFFAGLSSRVLSAPATKLRSPASPKVAHSIYSGAFFHHVCLLRELILLQIYIFSVIMQLSKCTKELLECAKMGVFTCIQLKRWGVGQREAAYSEGVMPKTRLNILVKFDLYSKPQLNPISATVISGCSSIIFRALSMRRRIM